MAARVTTQTAAGALPVLVVYALPHRDCGNYSVGGLPNADAYRAWVAQFASGIGTRKAVVVLEPDALAQMDCLSAADQTERTGLVAGAVRVLSANPGTSVYVDGGNAGWRLPSVMAGRLAAAGVAGARGFSLNVSNFATVASNESYGDAVSALVGRKPFLVDTGRAGAGPGTTWCNPDGRALGPVFTSVTGDPLADGFAWVKPPGNSDGPCNGGPPAGQFWPDYAIGLAQRAP